MTFPYASRIIVELCKNVIVYFYASDFPFLHSKLVTLILS